MTYKPHAKQAAILDAAYDILQSKPYTDQDGRVVQIGRYVLRP